MAGRLIPESRSGRWLALLCLAAALQIVLGLAGLGAVAGGVVEWPPPTRVLHWVRAIEIVALGGLAAYLLLGAGRDVRVAHLGALFLLIAVFFARPPMQALASALPAGAARGVLLLRSLTVDAFTPALAWLFARDFPRALESRRSAAFVRAAIRVCVAAALALTAANLAIAIRGEAGALSAFDSRAQFGHYWTVVFGLLLPVLPFMLWRTRHAAFDERRRVALFAGGIAVAGLLPVAIAVLPPWLPSLQALIYSDLGARVLIPVNLTVILAIAGLTAYSVAVSQVLPVRTVLRKAAQYGLARLVVGALVALPFALLLAEVYGAREQPIAALFSGTRLLATLGCVAAGAVVLRARRGVMLAVDRVFFREPYDARAVLARVAETARSEGPVALFGRSLGDEIDRALHLESCGLLVRALDADEYRPVGGPLRRLPGDSALARRLAEAKRPLRIELERPGGLLASLPDEDRVWLADAGAALLVPLAGSAGGVPGILSLGPKKSELPFSREDLLLLEAVAGATAIGLENRLLRDSARAARAAGEADAKATECTRCDRVGAPDEQSCPDCGAPVRPGTLPQELFGKFRVERRIGAGGMGVVYRATDLALGRTVALKTLPATSPEDAGRLRREARAMASITHPNLALILGAETWEGTPILVLEYLAGGTLADRIAKGGLPWPEVLELARVMARVLERAHGAGILHRDVKPSNIGFAAEGVPKLLDFGLARIAGDSALAATPLFRGGLTETGFAGTPLYMCPEALASQRPEPGFDLWSLGVVAFEAVTGVHPFEREGGAETLRAIQSGWTEALRERIPGCPDAVAALFARLLAADRARRPGSAGELAGWIEAALPVGA